MTRSRKRHPIVAFAGTGRKGMRAAKINAVRIVRRTGTDDLPDGMYYKRLDERWSWPDDGKCWRPEWPKAWRK